MAALLAAIGGPTLLLVIGRLPLPDMPRLDAHPPLVSAGMLARVAAGAAGVVAVPCPEGAAPGMPIVAAGLPGPAEHEAAAEALAARLPQ